mgnify:CR=1 FL=1
MDQYTSAVVKRNVANRAGGASPGSWWPCRQAPLEPTTLAPYNSFCQIYAVYTIAYTIAKWLKSAHGSRISWFPQEKGSSIGDSSSLIQLDVWRNCPTIWVILRLKSFLCSWYNVRFWKSGFPTRSPSKTCLCMCVKETTFHLIQTPLKFWFSLGFIFLGPIWGNSMLG